MSSHHKANRDAGRLKEGFELLHYSDDSIEIPERHEELPEGVHHVERRKGRAMYSGWLGVMSAYSSRGTVIEDSEDSGNYIMQDALSEFGFVPAAIPLQDPAEPLPPAHAGMGISGHHKYSSRPYARTARILHRRHIKRINHQRNQFLH